MNSEDKQYLPIRILHDFAGRLENLEIDYMLTGSMALAMYSIYRFTADLDIVMDLHQNKLSRLISSLEPDYYVPHDTARRAVDSKRMFNVIHRGTAYKVDCAIRKAGDFSESAFSRRQRTDFYSREIWVIGKDDLILSKLLWAKESGSEM